MIVNKILNAIAESISLKPNEIQEAQSKKNGISNYFSNQNISTDNYIQGSFSYGTAIRPLKKDRDGDFDLDIVCEVNGNFENPKRLKHWVGDILKNSPYKVYLDSEGKRCWTLNYENFHIDLLPAIVDSAKGGTFLKITTKNKETNEYSFTSSNPKGLTKWFLTINNDYFFSSKNNMKSILFNKNRNFFEDSMKYKSYNDIEDIFLSTSLQNTIKLLKRHRDQMFVNTEDEDYKPISVIITVLCTIALFKSEKKLVELHEVMDNFVANFSKYIKGNQGSWYISNPVDSLENLADRWRENGGIRATMFYKWIDSVQKFLNELSSSTDKTLKGVLEKYLGLDVAEKSLIALKQSQQSSTEELGNPASKPWYNNDNHKRRN